MKKKITILTLIIMFICVKTEATTSWSDSPKSITDSEFKEIIEQYTEYDVSGEDFTTYTGNYKYNNVLNAIFKDTYHKAFFDMGDNKVGIRYKTSAWNLSLSGQKYNLDYLITLVFDFQNKTLNYQSIDTNTEYFANKGWVIDLEDITTIDWQSEAYQQNLIYDSFFLVLGQFYGTENTLLNYIWDYEINSTTYEGIVYSGNILISEENESWLTTNLTESLLSGDYEYYVEFYAYDSNGVARNFTRKEYVKSINFANISVYQPTFKEVNDAIKKDTNYQDYVYTLALYKPDGNTQKTLIVSDLFIINQQPLAEIEYFVLKYEYQNYSPYIGIGGGDSSSGDNGNSNIAGDIEEGNNNYWGSQEDINKENQENLISGEISEIMNNASEKLQENEIFELINQYHNKIWEIFQGEEDFKIEWNSVQYMGKELIPKGSINFTEICEEEPFLSIKKLVNTIISFGIIISLIQQIYNLILSTLGIDNPYLYEDENYMQSTDAQTGEIKEKYYKNRRVYKK